MRFDTPLSTPPWTCDDHPGAERSVSRIQLKDGSPSRLTGLLGTRGGALDQHAASSAGAYTRGGIGHRAPHDNSGLHDRVRASSHGSSPDVAFAFLSGSGADPTGRLGSPSHAKRRGENALSRGALPAFTLSGRVHLPSNAAAGAEFRLPPIARDHPVIRLMFRTR